MGAIFVKLKGLFAKWWVENMFPESLGVHIEKILDCGHCFLSSRPFLQNDRYLPDLDRWLGWSDGRERPATWPLSQPTLLAQNTSNR
jgi:hypothetical protein